MALTYDDISSKTNKFIVPRLVDNVYKSSPVLTRLRTNNMERFEGGTTIRHPIMYAELRGGAFTRGGTFDISYVQTDTALEVNVKYLKSLASSDGCSYAAIRTASERYPMRLELAYIAAFLDCDGSFTIYRRKREVGGFNYSAKINFYSQNLSVLYEIKEIVGGEIGPPNEGLDVYTLQLSANSAVATARLLLPYLRIKREQALLMIEFQEVVDATPKLRNRSGKGGMARLPESVIEQRRQFYLRMQELNDRDPQAFRINRANSVKTPVGATPSQAVVGEGTTEGVTTRGMSPNNNSLQEGATGNGRHSLDSTVDEIIH